MMATSRQTEVCGSCNREQEASKGDRCVLCGKPTLTFNSDYESFGAAVVRWKKLFG